MKLLVASGNVGKVREYDELLAEFDLEIVSLKDVGLASMDVEENGDTFEANAEIKARAYAQASGIWTLADDSGLSVDALDGAPGVYSARYGGPGLDNAGRRAKLLDALKDLPQEKRTARFECVIAVVDPSNDELHSVYGKCEGQIALQESTGTSGFGYDPLFIPEGYAVTFADIPKTEKNRISHRGRAVQAIIPILQSMIEGR